LIDSRNVLAIDLAYNALSNIRAQSVMLYAITFPLFYSAVAAIPARLICCRISREYFLRQELSHPSQGIF